MVNDVCVFEKETRNPRSLSRSVVLDGLSGSFKSVKSVRVCKDAMKGKE